ncbi:MAG: hypothetical protein JWO75_3350 [Actinomycetia bacterium]|jgi:hypothetical protein|nr:hypothetical protein [Actinomycetes bacterium]
MIDVKSGENKAASMLLPERHVAAARGLLCLAVRLWECAR